MGKYIAGLLLCSVLFLSGCSFGSTTNEELSKVLTEMDDAEEGARTAQVKLNELEQAEQIHFEETMKLTQEEQAELKTKVTEMEELLTQRLAFIDEEEVAVKKAEASVKSLNRIVGKAKEDEKVEVEKLRDRVKDRYERHAVFVKAYKELAAAQKVLYKMLLIEETDLAALEQQVDEVNEQNETVISALQDFNVATASLNKLKKKASSILKKSDAK